MTIDEIKHRYVTNTLEYGLFTAGDKTVRIFKGGFEISTYQENGWIRLNIYEYDNETGLWTESETYEK